VSAPPVLFADRRYVVLNKPAGLASHAGPRGGASAEDWFGPLSRRRDGPWLAHRLDADTAGCLVVALRKTALLEAQALFAAGQVEKVYWAVVEGRPDADAGQVADRLVKRNGPEGWRMVRDGGGQAAVTDWRLAGIAAADRADASDPGALRLVGVPDRRGPDLWHGGCGGVAVAGALGPGAGDAGGVCGGAGAGAYARARPAGRRLCRLGRGGGARRGLERDRFKRGRPEA
jgi:hypothetical protein